MPPHTAFISQLIQRPVGSAVRQVGRSGSRPSLWLQRQQQTSISPGAALEARFSSTARTSRWRPQFKQMNSHSAPRVHSFLRRLFSTKPQSPSPSFSQRLKSLSREYGWSALGVYLALSALDFPFCFAAVRLLGVERIGHLEHVVVESVKDALKAVWPIKGTPGGGDPTGAEKEDIAHEVDHGVLEAEKRNSGEGASLWTQLALAYAIHKSFIFIRVPLTAAVTPKVVKTLRRWGWDIGKRISTAAKGN